MAAAADAAVVAAEAAAAADGPAAMLPAVVAAVAAAYYLETDWAWQRSHRTYQVDNALPAELAFRKADLLPTIFALWARQGLLVEPSGLMTCVCTRVLPQHLLQTQAGKQAKQALSMALCSVALLPCLGWERPWLLGCMEMAQGLVEGPD